MGVRERIVTIRLIEKMMKSAEKELHIGFLVQVNYER